MHRLLCTQRGAQGNGARLLLHNIRAAAFQQHIQHLLFEAVTVSKVVPVMRDYQTNCYMSQNLRCVLLSATREAFCIHH